MIEKLAGMQDTVWSGDGRFDSIRHSAKYGAYTMFSNTISKLVHFELVQAHEVGSSTGAELEGCKGAFRYLEDSRLSITSFVSDDHTGSHAFGRLYSVTINTRILHVLAMLHFNENVKRVSQRAKDGSVYYNVTYPKFKIGKEVVREVAVPPTYDYVNGIKKTMFLTSMHELKIILDQHAKARPDPLCTQFANRSSKTVAVQRYKEKQLPETPKFPPSMANLTHGIKY
eukprot:gene1048-374_t